jgi:hypothetical protein
MVGSVVEEITVLRVRGEWRMGSKKFGVIFDEARNGLKMARLMWDPAGEGGSSSSISKLFSCKRFGLSWTW